MVLPWQAQKTTLPNVPTGTRQCVFAQIPTDGSWTDAIRLRRRTREDEDISSASVTLGSMRRTASSCFFLSFLDAATSCLLTSALNAALAKAAGETRNSSSFSQSASSMAKVTWIVFGTASVMHFESDCGFKRHARARPVARHFCPVDITPPQPRLG